MHKTKLALSVVVLCCAGCPPSAQSGDLEVRSWNGNVLFAATVAVDEAGYDQGQLNYATFAAFTGAPHVIYSDNFATSTVAAQKEVLVLARDPFEFEATLESFNSEDNTPWLNNTVAPFEAPDTNRTVNGVVTLPYGYAIPYPIDDEHRDFGSDTTLAQRFFTGSDNTPFDGPAADDKGSTKGLYVYRHGVCSTEIPIRATILDPILSQLPGQLRDSINDGIPSGLAQGDPHVPVLNLSSFVQRSGGRGLFGGFVQQLSIHVPFQFPPFVNDAIIARNYTYTFILDGGILSASPAQNPGGWDTGFFSGTIASSIDGKMPGQLSTGIKLGALEKQAQPIPNLSTSNDPDCSQGDTQPPKCFQACTNVDSDPSKWPPTLSTGNGDDSAWYNVDYCKNAAFDILNPGIGAGANQYGITDARTIQQLQDNLTGLRSDDPSKFGNVRCNFHPKYVTASKDQNNGNPTPVCEFVVRAKRINVLPDTIELVWFDAPSVATAGTDEFTNEAFSVFLLAFSQNKQGKLCTRHPSTSSFSRAFAHNSIY